MGQAQFLVFFAGKNELGQVLERDLVASKTQTLELRVLCKTLSDCSDGLLAEAAVVEAERGHVAVHSEDTLQAATEGEVLCIDHNWLLQDALIKIDVRDLPRTSLDHRLQQ